MPIRSLTLSLLFTFALLSSCNQPFAKLAGSPSDYPLVITADMQSQAIIIVADGASGWERRAAEDLARYINRITGASIPVLEGTSPLGRTPLFFVGKAALEADPSLQLALRSVAKRSPLIRADAIAVRRRDRAVYLAGTNDDSHYFAVAWLLQQWGCRWYMPTDFGEVVPRHGEISIGSLDFAYAPPFEIRHYWLSWHGDSTGAQEFRRRNFMTETSMVGMGHAFGEYVKDFPGVNGDAYRIPFSDLRLAHHVADKIDDAYRSGKDVSLAIDDGSYLVQPTDARLIVEYDRYMLRPSISDALMTFYNNVGQILRQRHPESSAKIGGMAYSNATLPPRVVDTVEPNVVMWLAPIDIDPNHSMDDPRSPPRQEYKGMLERWAAILNGRLAIYDYDQSMLIWRDLPNPSHQVFARDVQHYRRLGILGIGTESRGATATTFLNLYFRGQLMWNPDLSVDEHLKEFYPAFYGPAAPAMEAYWGAIFRAWRDTTVTEHEYFVAPAIYTPELVQELATHLERAEASLAHLTEVGRSTGAGSRYLERMRFTRLGFEVLQNYMEMVSQAAANANYAAAVAAGERALAAREALTDMNLTFTTYRSIGENGRAWFPGEVQHMKELVSFVDGTRGSLVALLPLEWEFRRDAVLPANWVYTGPLGEAYAERWPRSPSMGSQRIRADAYAQARGIIAAEGSTEFGWYSYRTTFMIPEGAGSSLSMVFPGLFNEVWLYVNGKFVAHRNYEEPWWKNDYRFTWVVDVSGVLRTNQNEIELRGFNPHHMAGLFRRPFVYSARP